MAVIPTSSRASRTSPRPTPSLSPTRSSCHPARADSRWSAASARRSAVEAAAAASASSAACQPGEAAACQCVACTRAHTPKEDGPRRRGGQAAHRACDACGLVAARERRRASPSGERPQQSSISQGERWVSAFPPLGLEPGVRAMRFMDERALLSVLIDVSVCLA